MVGKKLTAPSGEGDDDAPKRQGVSFEVFKVPEVEAVEPPEDAPEDWAPPPPPGPQPLVIDNCMRDTRCKFFGIPKLGSYCAIPLVYSSSDHTEGIVQGEALAVIQVEPEEGEEPPAPIEPEVVWNQQKTVSQSMALCVDTIGNYRSFSTSDIDTLKLIGSKLVNVFESFETKQYQSQADYLNASKGQADVVALSVAKIAETEAEALAAANPPPAELEDGAEAPPAVAETLKAQKDAEVILRNCTAHIGSTPEISGLITGLAKHVLPPVPAVINLIAATAMLLNGGNACRDVYGEITWVNIINKCIPNICAEIASYDANAVDSARLSEIKGFIEANVVLPGEFPATCAGCTALALWLTKALAAADAFAAHAAFLATPVDAPEEE